MSRILTAAVFTIVLVAGCSRSQPRHETQPSAREAEVAAKGAGVMPFDLDRTTHVFEKLTNGGRQQVVSDDGDAGQTRLIRQHLAEEAERFARGDFHDPAMIHGDDMAGLHALVMGHERINIEYTEIAGGGQITYETSDPSLVTAVHEWFDQQLSDHGRHATSDADGHSGQH